MARMGGEDEQDAQANQVRALWSVRGVDTEEAPNSTPARRLKGCA